MKRPCLYRPCLYPACEMVCCTPNLLGNMRIRKAVAEVFFEPEDPSVSSLTTPRDILREHRRNGTTAGAISCQARPPTGVVHND